MSIYFIASSEERTVRTIDAFRVPGCSVSVRAERCICPYCHQIFSVGLFWCEVCYLTWLTPSKPCAFLFAATVRIQDISFCVSTLQERPLHNLRKIPQSEASGCVPLSSPSISFKRLSSTLVMREYDIELSAPTQSQSSSLAFSMHSL